MSKRKQKYSFRTFRRNGLIYVRFFNSDGLLIATRSTKTGSKTEASSEIMRMLAELDLDAISEAREEKKEVRELAELSENERLARLPFADFVASFWAPKSPYLGDHEAAGRALSGKYVATCLSHARLYVAPYPAFQRINVGEVRFSHIDGLARALRLKKKSRYVIDRTLDAIRTPLSWAHARGLAEAVDFSGLILPEAPEAKRGIFSGEEVAALLAVETQEVWRADSGVLHIDARPRPRLPKGQANVGPEPVDIRQKAAALLALFTGMRRGEIRGLKWGAVDLEAGILRIENNYTNEDGDKRPKAGSSGIVPIAEELDPLFDELKTVAALFGRDGPDDYVLINPVKRSLPIDPTTINRGWSRMLAAIGIDEEERKRRKLVLHGARHRFATVLVDSGALTPAEIQKMTRHKTLAMLGRYADHVQDETLKKAKKALRRKP